MATGYEVTGGAVVAQFRDGGGEGYFYEGAFLPDIVSEAEKERLVDIGLVTKIELLDIEDAVEILLVDPIEGLDIDGLTAFAATHQVDLGKATSEDGIRTKIREAGFVPASPAVSSV